MKHARNSNIEALRIVAMFLILVIHVNFFSIGEPTTEKAVTDAVPTFVSCLFQSIAYISVDLFVLISGWFGISFSIKRLATFVFQSIFVITGIYIIGLIVGYASFNETQLLECFFLSKHGWFIKAYIGLMIFSPILNCFLKYSTKNQLLVTLVCFFVFQTLYGCLTVNTQFINFGYSTFSFAGLYLLSRYVRTYCNITRKAASILLLVSFMAYFLWTYLPVRFGVMRLFYMSQNYTNPMCIAFAMSVLIVTTRLSFRSNKVINWIAASTFAVYLCHMCNTWSANLYKQTAINIYDSYSGLSYLGHIVLFMTAVFTASIVINQPVKWLWNRIVKAFTPPHSLININYSLAIIST